MAEGPWSFVEDGVEGHKGAWKGVKMSMKEV